MISALTPPHTHTHTSLSLSPSVAGEDKSDSISSDEEIAFSSDEEDGLTTTAVDHYESLVSYYLYIMYYCMELCINNPLLQYST